MEYSDFYNDMPLDNVDQDYLNIRYFIDTLVNTIQNSQTPYTISLYGEWGSGKTSALQMVKTILESKKQERAYKCIWINAWDLSTLTDSTALRELFIAKILSSIFPNDNLTTLISGLVSSCLLTLVGDIVPKADKIAEKLTKVIESVNHLPIEQKFAMALKKGSKILGFKKTCIFIDDLDRISAHEVLTILDAIKIFFKIEGAVFILALDQRRINAELLNNNRDVCFDQASSYLDKMIQLNIAMPMEHYDVKTYIQQLSTKKLFPDRRPYVVDIYTSLAIYSVGKIPRTIKVVMAQFNFYASILYKSLHARNINTDVTFYPFASSYLNQALFAIICFKFSYPEIFDLFILSEVFTKDFFTRIEYIIKLGKISDKIDTMLKTHLNNYVSNKNLSDKLIKFIPMFILGVELYENQARTFSFPAVFLLNEMIDLVNDKPIINKINYFINEEQIIDVDNLKRSLNNYFSYYLEWFDTKIICEFDKGYIFLFHYKSGPFSFTISIRDRANTLKLCVESPLTFSTRHKKSVYDFITKHCVGLPKSIFIPSEKKFIEFESIVWNAYDNYIINKGAHLIKTVKKIFYAFFEPLIQLKFYNDAIIYKLNTIKSILLSEINEIFIKKDGWLIDNRIDISNRWKGLFIWHESWNKKITLCIEPQEIFMQKLAIGFRKEAWNGKFKKNREQILYEKIKIQNQSIVFLQSMHWIIYHYTSSPSYTKGSYYPLLELVEEDYVDINRKIIDALKMYKSYQKDIALLLESALF